MDFSQGGTFTRGSNAYYRVGTSQIVQVASNVRRFENGRIFIEGSRTGTFRRSEELDNASWIKTNCTISANVVTAPDGASTADRITTTADSVTTSIALTTVTAPTGNLAFQFWYRGDTSFTGSYTVTSGAASASADINVTTTWQRVTGHFTGATVAPTVTIRPHAGAGSGVAGRVMYVWGVGTENSTVPSSYILTTSANATRSADTLTYTSGNWPTYLATGNYSIDFVPMGTSGQVNAVADILSFGGASDRLSLSNIDQINVVVGGVTQVTGNTLTWSADQVITVTVRPAAGTITVSGATTGNGTSVGTSWSWPTAVTMRVGGRQASTAEAYAGISNPVRA
jgi:hypothetical protein